MRKRLKEKGMRNVVIAVVVGLFIMGCATTSSTPIGSAKTNFVPAEEGDQSAVYADATYDSAFEAVKNAYFDLNVDITAGSKESGFLNGREMLESERATALIPGTRLVYNSYYSVILSQSDDSIRIRIRIVNEYRDGTSRSEASHAVYARFWEHVDKALTQ
jgi:hypothetical protein